MELVGEFFKHVRETKGLTIDEVASKTRIRTDYLKALEEGNFAKLPDLVFAKGFVRTYARSLGLDEDDAMRRFAQSAGTFYDKQEERERLRVRQAEDERRRRSNRKTLVLALGVCLLVLVLLLTREQSGVVFNRPTPEPPPLALQTPIPAPLPPSDPLVSDPTTSSVPEHQMTGPEGGTEGEAAGLPPSLSPPTPSPLASAAVPEASSLPVSIPGGLLGEPTEKTSLVLNIEALELTWVVVQVDGGSPHEALLQPGDRVSWAGRDQFTLTLGNAGGVRVEVNGKLQGPFGPSGVVARDIVLRHEEE